MAQDRSVGDVDGGSADVAAAGGDTAIGDQELIDQLTEYGMLEAAQRLAHYAGLAPDQQRISDETRDQGLAWAEHMAFDGVPFWRMTCDDAVATAAIMAVRAKQLKDEAAMPKLILPPGVR